MFHSVYKNNQYNVFKDPLFDVEMFFLLVTYMYGLRSPVFCTLFQNVAKVMSSNSALLVDSGLVISRLKSSLYYLVFNVLRLYR